MDRVVYRIDEKIKERIIKFDYGVRWMLAGNLQSGMEIFAVVQRDIRTIKDVRRFYTEETVYNLRVSEDNSYVTLTCTVHNCGSTLLIP